VKLGQVLPGGSPKQGAFFLSAVNTDVDRFAEIQTEHTHEAFGIDQGAAVAGYHPEGLDSGDFHKILDLRKGAQNNVELLQGFSLPVLYKWRNFMYNETASKIIIKYTPMLPIIPRFCNFSIDALDEIYKSVYSNLVKIT
jgi:hypothetical protein